MAVGAKRGETLPFQWTIMGPYVRKTFEQYAVAGEK